MAGWVAAATVASAAIGANASSKAAKTQAGAANRATDLEYKQYQQTREDQMPWMKAGEAALNKLIPLTDYQKFGMDQFQSDPGYAFRLSEGQKALDRSAAARGGLISGGALKAAARYGQDMGSQEYQNAFNRYQAERTAQLQPLQSLAGVGLTTAQALGTAGQNYASNAGNIGMTNAINQGNARMSRASTYSDTINQLSRLYGGSNYGRPVGGGFQGGGQVNPVSGEYMGSLEF